MTSILPSRINPFSSKKTTPRHSVDHNDAGSPSTMRSTRSPTYDTLGPSGTIPSDHHERSASGISRPGTPRTPLLTSSNLDVNHTSSEPMPTSAGLEPPNGRMENRMEIPFRTSTQVKQSPHWSREGQVERTTSLGRKIPSAMSNKQEGKDRSSVDSATSADTDPSSVSDTLPALQTKGPIEEMGQLELLEDDDPACFDLLAPGEPYTKKTFDLVARSETLFSREHLETIFEDPNLLLRFTSFLSTQRPQSIPILIYYLDAMKALRAIKYANAVQDSLEGVGGHDFTQTSMRPTSNPVLEEKADLAFQALVRDDLPAFVTNVFIQIVSTSIRQKVTGCLPANLRESSEGLAEVFCLTDPARPDNPIIFASQEFHRTTQYGVNYAIGRNCRFLQGPNTNPHTVRRLGQAVKEGRELSEVFLNYRRDGSPFMNLLTMAPLLDSRGKIRYFIGAQVDVSNLVKQSTDLEAMQRLLVKQDKERRAREQRGQESIIPKAKPDEFEELSAMFNTTELDTVKKHGGRMHREPMIVEEGDGVQRQPTLPRLLLKDRSPDLDGVNPIHLRANGKLQGVFEHYLLVRPAPSLRILFTSPSLRVPGIMQSSFMPRVGGSERVRKDLGIALTEGRGVTAKIRWLSGRSDDVGRPRWIHCTPLLGMDGRVGVWMVILVDEESSSAAKGGPIRKFKAAPPVRAVGPDGRMISEQVEAEAMRRKMESRDRARQKVMQDMVAREHEKRQMLTKAKSYDASVMAMRTGAGGSGGMSSARPTSPAVPTPALPPLRMTPAVAQAEQFERQPSRAGSMMTTQSYSLE